MRLPSSKSTLLNGSPIPRALLPSLEPRVEPRVYERDGFAVTFWTYYGFVTPRQVSPSEYANALKRLHEGMRRLDVATPHFMDRVAAPNSSLRAGTTRRRSPTRTGSF